MSKAKKEHYVNNKVSRFKPAQQLVSTFEVTVFIFDTSFRCSAVDGGCAGFFSKNNIIKNSNTKAKPVNPIFS